MARKSAEERREEIVEIAFRHFAEGGYRGTSTEAIAKAAGISQPYLFRLFRTKKGLFLACVDRCYAMVIDVFTEAAAAAPEGERLSAMGRAYKERLLPDRHALLFQMQSYSAVSDPEIQAYVRHGHGELVKTVARLGGVTPLETWEFFASGLLMTLVASLDLQAIAGEDDWARAWTTLEA
jgi:AcrR family transcriptional regulator